MGLNQILPPHLLANNPSFSDVSKAIESFYQLEIKPLMIMFAEVILVSKLYSLTSQLFGNAVGQLRYSKVDPATFFVLLSLTSIL